MIDADAIYLISDAHENRKSQVSPGCVDGPAIRCSYRQYPTLFAEANRPVPSLPSVLELS
jgi:hypothetical protein